MARLFERGIAPDDVLQVINTGQTIQEYPDDKPYPSHLILGYIGQRPVHVVAADAEEQCVVVTVYEPDRGLWNDTFTQRSTK